MNRRLILKLFASGLLLLSLIGFAFLLLTFISSSPPKPAQFGTVFVLSLLIAGGGLVILGAAGSE